MGHEIEIFEIFKENEKFKKYVPLKDEIAQMQRMGKVVLIPVDVGVLGAVPNRFQKFAEGLKQIKRLSSFRKQCQWEQQQL